MSAPGAMGWGAATKDAKERPPKLLEPALLPAAVPTSGVACSWCSRAVTCPLPGVTTAPAAGLRCRGVVGSCCSNAEPGPPWLLLSELRPEWGLARPASLGGLPTAAEPGERTRAGLLGCGNMH